MSVNNIQGDATPAPNVTSGSRPDSNTATPTSQYDANTLDQLTEEERTEINEAFDKLEAAGDKELYVYLSGGTDNAFCGSHWNHSHQTKGTMLMLFIEDDGTRKTELAGCCPESAENSKGPVTMLQIVSAGISSMALSYGGARHEYIWPKQG